MAINSTVFKVLLAVADGSRGYYQDHALTVARHPSETDLRMLVRLVAFAANAHERLQFTKGLGDVDEPDLWQMDLTGGIEHWIDLGQPVIKRIRQSCSKAQRVTIYSYQEGAVGPWYAGIKDDVARFKHLRIVLLAVADAAGVAAFIDRSMRLSCMIDDGQVLLASDSGSLNFSIQVLKESLA